MKWSGKVHDVDVDVSDSVETFKTQIWMLTGVPAGRQKIMGRGLWKGILKDNAL